MLNPRINRQIILLLAVLMPFSLAAYYRDTSSEVVDQPGINRIIVKLSADSKIEISKSSNGIAKTGVAAIDDVSIRYAIAQMEILFPKILNEEYPDDLKNIIVIQIREELDFQEILDE